MLIGGIWTRVAVALRYTARTDVARKAMVTLLDPEIAHLARVMGASMIGDLEGPILPAAYFINRSMHST